MVDGARDFRLMKRKMVDAIISMGEYNRYTKGIFGFVGFETKWIDYRSPDRVAGKSKYSLIKLFKYALEGMVAFSTTPLVISAFIGIIFCLIAFIAALTTMTEFPILILPILIVVGPGVFFIVKKFLNNLKQLTNNEFEE